MNSLEDYIVSIRNTFEAFFSFAAESTLDLFTNLLGLCIDFLNFITKIFFGWINIPPFPEELKNSIESFFNLIFDNLSLLGFFIRPFTLKIIIPLILILIGFIPIYKLIFWIIKKIPFLHIS